MRVVWARMVELKVVEWTEFADGPDVQDEKREVSSMMPKFSH